MMANFLSLLTIVACAAAQYVSGPYALRVTGKDNTTIAGYIGACHAGAAIEGMCYLEGPLAGLSNYETYYLNSSAPNSTQGLLVWQLPIVSGDGSEQLIPSALTLEPNYGSNVGVPLFQPGASSSSGLYVNVGDNGELHLNGGADDTSNNETYPSPVQYTANLTNWNLCYQFTGGYYYHSIGWVFGSQPAQNPSCEPVTLGLETPANVTVY